MRTGPLIDVTVGKTDDLSARCARVRCVRIALCVAAVLILALPALAIDPSDPTQALTQYRIDGWKSEQGLPLDTVQTLLQTRDGHLWVGTGGGLARFDGIR